MVEVAEIAGTVSKWMSACSSALSSIISSSPACSELHDVNRSVAKLYFMSSVGLLTYYSGTVCVLGCLRGLLGLRAPPAAVDAAPAVVAEGTSNAVA